MIVSLLIWSYLIGSIPVAWLLTKLATGQDLRELGSGNVGVMNTALSVHRWAGVFVFTAEIIKGALAVILAQEFDGSQPAVGLTVLATVVGTRWSVWLRFRGGRGNTAAVAALVLISPLTVVAMLALNLAVRVMTSSSFTAMRVSLLSLPIVFGAIAQSWWWVLFGACFSLIFFTTHRVESDDRLLIKERWQSLWRFLSAPKRKER